jgi:hypothetical protein
MRIISTWLVEDGFSRRLGDKKRKNALPHCSRCGEKGHTIRTCDEAPECVGRPRFSMETAKAELQRRIAR